VQAFYSADPSVLFPPLPDYAPMQHADFEVDQANENEEGSSYAPSGQSSNATTPTLSYPSHPDAYQPMMNNAANELRTMVALRPEPRRSADPISDDEDYMGGKSTARSRKPAAGKAVRKNDPSARGWRLP
jgi:hypothetical protein